MEQTQPDISSYSSPQTTPSLVVESQIMETKVGVEEKAGFILRAAAYTLDGFVLAFLVGFLSLILAKIGFKTNLLDIISSFIFLLYFIIATGIYGTTLGKQFFSLKVVDDKGDKPGLGKAFLREFIGKIISSIPFSLGFFWVIWDKQKQAWHDKIAKTHVVCSGSLGKGKKTLAFIIVFALPILAFLGILAVVILVAINPKEQLRKARQAAEEKQSQPFTTLTPTPTLRLN